MPRPYWCLMYFMVDWSVLQLIAWFGKRHCAKSYFIERFIAPLIEWYQFMQVYFIIYTCTRVYPYDNKFRLLIVMFLFWDRPIDHLDVVRATPVLPLILAGWRYILITVAEHCFFRCHCPIVNTYLDTHSGWDGWKSHWARPLIIDDED